MLLGRCISTGSCRCLRLLSTEAPIDPWEVRSGDLQNERVSRKMEPEPTGGKEAGSLSPADKSFVVEPGKASSASPQRRPSRASTMLRLELRDWIVHSRSPVQCFAAARPSLQGALAVVEEAVKPSKLRPAMQGLILLQKMKAQERILPGDKATLEKWARDRSLDGHCRVIRAQREGLNDARPVRFSDADAAAFAILYSPAVYFVMEQILGDVKRRLPGFSPTSLLDFGTGCGTAIIAANDAFETPALRHITAVEISSAVTDTAVQMLRAVPGLSKKVIFRAVQPRLNQDLPRYRQYDLVTCAYSLGDLHSEAMQREVVLSLWRSCSGVLVIVEPATAAGFSLVLKARNWLLDCSATERNKVPVILAPCAHSQACPMQRLGRICSSSVHYVRKKNDFSRIMGDAGPAEERFAYVVFRRANCDRLPLPASMFSKEHQGTHAPSPDLQAGGGDTDTAREAEENLEAEDELGVVWDGKANANAAVSSKGNAAAGAAKQENAEVPEDSPRRQALVQTLRSWMEEYLREAHRWPRVVGAPETVHKLGGTVMTLCHEDGNLRKHFFPFGYEPSRLLRKVVLGELCPPALGLLEGPGVRLLSDSSMAAEGWREDPLPTSLAVVPAVPKKSGPRPILKANPYLDAPGGSVDWLELENQIHLQRQSEIRAQQKLRAKRRKAQGKHCGYRPPGSWTRRPGGPGWLRKPPSKRERRQRPSRAKLHR
eukprot:RCo050093